MCIRVHIRSDAGTYTYIYIYTLDTYTYMLVVTPPVPFIYVYIRTYMWITNIRTYTNICTYIKVRICTYMYVFVINTHTYILVVTLPVPIRKEGGVFDYALMNAIYMCMRVCVCVHYTNVCVCVYAYHISTYACACLRGCNAASTLASSSVSPIVCYGVPTISSQW